MKQIQVTLIISLLFTFVLISKFTNSTKLETKSLDQLKNEIESQNPISISSWNVPDVPIHFQGWVRYYHYTSEKKINEPRLFFQNDKFYDQRISVNKVNKKDKYGLIKIPNKAAFFMVVKNETLNMYQERQSGGYLSGAVDGLNLRFITRVSKRYPGVKGIRNFGEFKLGSCIEIEAKIPLEYHPIYDKRAQSHKTSIWQICTDEKKEKMDILKTLIKLKVKIQEKEKDPFDMLLDAKEKAEDEIKVAKTLTPLQKKQLTLPKDGYWELLQDWTTCTLKCGGGWSYQHFFCNPPKNGGRPCQGEAIKKRPCNVQPCPSIEDVLKNSHPDPEVRKPIIEVRKFTQRPQRYSMCELRENDAFLATYDPVIKADNKLPVRMVMNDKTLSIYKDDTYHELFYSYDLVNSEIHPSTTTNCCIIVKDTYKKTKLCGYRENCNSGSFLNGPTVGVEQNNEEHIENAWAKSWEKDFQIFKVVCKHGKQAVLLSEEDLKDIPPSDNGDGGKSQMMFNKLAEEESEQNAKKISSTTDMGFRAIQKENNLELMIANEEKEKGRQELQNLRRKIEDEKKKLNCLHKTIDEKDIEDPQNENKNEAEELKAKFQQKIAQKRANMKNILDNIRRKNKLKRDQLDQELKDLKSKIAGDLLRANYVGDMKKCIRGKTDVDYRDVFCNHNYSDSFLTNKDCHSDDLWCEMCCEHEYGNLYIKKRYECFDKCDAAGVPKKKPTATANEPGRWLWTEKFYTGGDPVNPTRVPAPATTK